MGSAALTSRCSLRSLGRASKGLGLFGSISLNRDIFKKVAQAAVISRSGDLPVFGRSAGQRARIRYL